jgi:hypothetical protein
VAEDRLIADAEHSAPQLRRPRNRATERDEYAPVKPLPPSRGDVSRDRMPGNPYAECLLTGQNAMLPTEKVRQ